jgi:hypothetical protein
MWASDKCLGWAHVSIVKAIGGVSAGLDWLLPLDKIVCYYMRGRDMNRYPDIGFEGGTLEAIEGVMDLRSWIECFDVDEKVLEGLLAESWEAGSEPRMKTCYEIQYIIETICRSGRN